MPNPRPAMPATTRARLGGLAKVARHGSSHMADMQAKGRAALDARIAREAGIPEDAPDYEVRLQAARRVWFTRIRMGGRREPATRATSNRTGRTPGTPTGGPGHSVGAAGRGDPSGQLPRPSPDDDR